MTPELLVLTLAALLQATTFCAYSLFGTLQAGIKVTAGNRDEGVELHGKTARLQRAFNNMFEALILFTIAVTVLTLADKTSGLTANCAWVFLGARVLYIPAYILGLTPWRSVIWFVGALATILMLLLALVQI